MNRKPWTKAEDALIRRLVAEGRIREHVARSVPGREPGAVMNRMDTLGLKARRETPEENARRKREQYAAAAGPGRAALIAKVRQLAAAGRSAQSIAALVGKTRNAVLGICWREGIALAGRDRDGSLVKKARAARPKRCAKDSNPTGWAGLRERPKGPPLPPSPPSCPRVSIAGLTRRHCRFIGERPELMTLDTPIYCGEATDGGPWCAFHRALVLVPVPGSAARLMRRA